MRSAVSYSQMSFVDSMFEQQELALTDDYDDAGFKNEIVALPDAALLANIREIQQNNNVKISDKLINNLGRCSLDVEMETGTGKTYVYIKTMYELNKYYGWSKFIVVVPSIAIREGVKKSFEITQDHFMEQYGKKVRFFVYNSSNLNQLDAFSSNSGINVMIINMQAFNTSMKEGGKSKEARIIYDKRDEFGSRRPIDVIKANNPIIILDEPQKMGGDATQKALQNFNPLFCLNYSATHKEHHNLVYALDAVDAYNQRLVKRIEVKGFQVKNFRGTDKYLYLESIIISPKHPPRARIEFEVKYDKSINREMRILGVDDNLYELSKNMEQYKGYRISEIDPIVGSVTFTNGEVIHKRTPSVLFSHLAVKNPVSLNEWKKHQSINAWTISPKRILFSAQCEHPAIEATILAFCNQIDEELRNGTVILSNLSDDGMGINMETYKIPLPPQVDRRKIQAKKDIISGKPIYRYHDTKFSLSKKQIIDLLMGTKLYGKPEVALRELLQNSIDACLLRQKLSELWGIEYTPKVKVSLYTKNNVDYLQVSDNGVGMNQHIIDNYYTNIGCSYYSSREFSDLMVSFKSSFTPISRFGIGILSCFMVCDSMEVTTRRIRERFECDEALHVSIEGYESLFVISDSDKKDPGTDTILTLRPVHPWDRMDEDEFVQCIKGIVPNPAVQIEIETDKRSESYSSDYFDDLDLSPLLDYSWNNTKNIRKIDIDLTCEEYGFKGRGCIGILIKNDMPVEEIEILSKDVEIDGEIYTLSSSVKYKNNCITETSTSISVDEDGEIDTNTSWSERFKSKSSLSIHGIEVPYNLFPNYSNKMSKAVLNILFPFSFRLDIGVNSDLNLNSARDQIIYDEKWLTFEENLYQVICKRLKEQLSLSDWERLNEIIQKNGKNIFSRVANNIE